MKSRRLLLLAAPVSLLVDAPLSLADEPPGCPPGEWFCDDTAAEEAPPETEPEPDGTDFEPAPERDPSLATSDDVESAPAPASADLAWSEGSGPHGASAWGLALRVEGALIENGGRGDTGMGGLGISGRFALNRVVTLDLGLDSLLGTDYNGYSRSELCLSFSSLFFLNDHPVVRTYLLAGLNTSAAHVDVLGDDQTWNYLGLQGGLGLEFSLDPRLAVNVDILAFMRGRLDSRAAREPEFIDSSGRVSNTSGGGLVRGGVVLRF
jgi:hypothetical protein